MRIKLSNREWHYLRILDCARLRTITVYLRSIRISLLDSLIESGKESGKTNVADQPYYSIDLTCPANDTPHVVSIW